MAQPLQAINIEHRAKRLTFWPSQARGCPQTWTEFQWAINKQQHKTSSRVVHLFKLHSFACLVYITSTTWNSSWNDKLIIVIKKGPWLLQVKLNQDALNVFSKLRLNVRSSWNPRSESWRVVLIPHYAPALRRSAKLQPNVRSQICNELGNCPGSAPSWDVVAFQTQSMHNVSRIPISQTHLQTVYSHYWAKFPVLKMVTHCNKGAN